jgi:hypothetical protein
MSLATIGFSMERQESIARNANYPLDEQVPES